MKSYRAVVSDILTRKFSENRYVVVNQAGDVIDNNKGDGFRTERKALTHYELKTFGKSPLKGS